jgi:DNA repair exonuclease SbcCD ATPase subunit
MRLRAVRLENWRCIGRLELTDLQPGITVLYGPNGTGKSSLVTALRCCLFDFAHNTKDQELLQHKPWRSETSPKVMVEWEQNSTPYRVRKTYSIHRDGESVLEEFSAREWRKKCEGAREVADKLREMFGAESSSSGLYQLLWLEQGAVQLPKQLCGSLQQQLFQVLGTLVTNRDRAFQQALDKRLEKWFTQKKMEHRTGKNASPVIRLENRLADKQKELDDLETQHRELEQVQRQMADLEDSLPRLRDDAEAAQKRLEDLQRERERLRDRVQEHRRATDRLQEAQKRLQAERAKRQAQEEALQRLGESQQAALQATRAREEAQAQVDRCAREVEQIKLKCQAHQQLVDSTRQELENLEDQRRFLGLRDQAARLTDLLDHVREAEKEIQAVEETLKATAVVDNDTLKQLRENRRQAQTLTAKLQAETLDLRLEPQHLATVELQRDDEKVEMFHLPAKKSFTATAFQQFVLRLANWGEVVVSRAKADGSLERDAQHLHELDEAYGRALKIYQEDPSDPDSLDRLNERRLQRERQRQRLELLQHNLNALAPQGKASIIAELRRLAQERQALVQRRPYLEKWEPEDVEQQSAEQMQRALHQKYVEQLQAMDAAVAAAQQAQQKAEARLHTCKEDLLELQATTKARQEECQRLGDTAELAKQVAQAEASVQQAQQQQEATKLRPEEAGIGQRLVEAENALRQKQERLRQAEDELHRLRGRLEGSEGLHLKRADAAAALRTCTDELARERLEADAHKLLRELFDQGRENQVRQVMGPISDRVQTWARQLGLHDLPPLRFSDSFLPDGFTHPRSAEETLGLEQESYGIAELLSLLVRLALGGILTRQAPVMAIFDDPLAHTDALRRRRFMEILHQTAQSNPATHPPTGPMQILILTCHPEWFDELPGVQMTDLVPLIQRS